MTRINIELVLPLAGAVIFDIIAIASSTTEIGMIITAAVGSALVVGLVIARDLKKQYNTPQHDK